MGQEYLGGMGRALGQPHFPGSGDGLRAAADTELFVDMAGVDLYRCDRKEQLLCNLRVRKTISHEVENF